MSEALRMANCQESYMYNKLDYVHVLYTFDILIILINLLEVEGGEISI